jgi:hypothetical protein
MAKIHYTPNPSANIMRFLTRNIVTKYMAHLAYKLACTRCSKFELDEALFMSNDLQAIVVCIHNLALSKSGR